jgi:hypothetical protein
MKESVKRKPITQWNVAGIPDDLRSSFKDHCKAHGRLMNGTMARLMEAFLKLPVDQRIGNLVVSTDNNRRVTPGH